MNILFVTHRNVDPLIGGIERVTYDLATELVQRGVSCYSAYLKSFERESNIVNIFTDSKKISEDNIREDFSNIISKKHIHFVIAQGADWNVTSIIRDISEAVRSAESCKLIFMFHNMPGFEFTKMNTKVLLHRILNGQSLVYNLKYMLFQTLGTVARKAIHSKIEKKYRIPYQLSDKVVVLTEKFREKYARYANVPCDDKICSIPNILPYKQKYDKKSGEKQKEVLWVGRFDDRHKRLSLALEAWRRIEGEFPDWVFRIVGYGEDEDYYRAFVKSSNLRNVRFEGLKDPYPYYGRASVFMMTSAFEGFGMVLLEALSMGAVPIAFDSFEPLHDMVEDGINGFIVEDGRMRDYCSRLRTLMSNQDLREAMSMKGVDMVDKFSAESVIPKWMELLGNLAE